MDGSRRRFERFFAAWTAVDSMYDEYAKEVGITYTLLIVLDFLYYSEGDVTQTNICSASYCPKQTVNSVINGLQKKGYVELHELPGDRRNKCVRLTAAGREYAERLLSRMWRAETTAVEMLDEETAESMIHGIEEYTRNFKKYLRKTD